MTNTTTKTIKLTQWQILALANAVAQDTTLNAQGRKELTELLYAAKSVNVRVEG